MAGMVENGPPQIRKILVSVKFLSAILGPEMAAPILWAPKISVVSAGNLHVHKFPHFRGGGGILVFFWGGEVPILFFMGAGIFLKRGH